MRFWHFSRPPSKYSTHFSFRRRLLILVRNVVLASTCYIKSSCEHWNWSTQKACTTAVYQVLLCRLGQLGYELVSFQSSVASRPYPSVAKIGLLLRGRAERDRIILNLFCVVGEILQYCTECCRQDIRAACLSRPAPLCPRPASTARGGCFAIRLSIRRTLCHEAATYYNRNILTVLL